MTIYALQADWVVVRELGRGGFGTVFEVANGESRMALKVIPGVASNWRDLLVNDIPEGPYAIPIVDSGEAGGSGLLLMPLAEMSLRDLVIQRAPLDEQLALAILSDLVAGLDAMDRAGVVHRDIKPENVLLHEGTWKLSDFGESRYADATTALSTRKQSMTPEYAAPERWWDERATSRSDVYSWAVMAFELIAGARPFPGPRENLREQHLTWPPPPLATSNPALAALIRLCLAKSPEARPKPAELRRRLQALIDPVQAPGLQNLAAAGAKIAETIASESLVESNRRLRALRREGLFEDAVPILGDLAIRFRDVILDHAVVATDQSSDRNLVGLQIGAAQLVVTQPWGISDDIWEESIPPFEVIAAASIKLIAGVRSHQNIRGREHALWYGDIQRRGEFEWYEVAFYNTTGPSNAMDDFVPFSVDPTSANMQIFLGRRHDFQLARPFTPFTYETVEESIASWAEWLAEAALGPISADSSLPAGNPSGSWRRPGDDLASVVRKKYSG